MLEKIRTENDLARFDSDEICRNILMGGKDRLLEQEEFIRWLKLVGAYWFFDYHGDPTRPHAELTSGKHSDGFVDCLKLLKYPRATAVIAAQLVKKIRISPEIPSRSALDLISWVFGSPMAGVTLAFETAKILGARAGFTEKNPAGENDPSAPRKIQKRFTVRPGETVLLVEELITTLTTAEEQKIAISEEVDYLPALGVFFNRSGQTAFNGWPIISVVEQKITNWSPGDCPLCKKGSRAIKPKQNWKELTGK